MIVSKQVEEVVSRELGYTWRSESELTLKWGFIAALTAIPISVLIFQNHDPRVEHLALWFGLSGAALGFTYTRLRNRRWERRVEALVNQNSCLGE